MPKTCVAVVTFVLSTFAAAAVAQSPSVPIPSQFASAKSLFLGSGGAAILGSREKEATAMLYSSASNALSSGSRYRLTGAPADADLYAVISIESFANVINGNPPAPALIRLAVFDTKTHALLWNIDEPVDGAIRKVTFQKSIEESMAKIVIDLDSLAAGKLP